MSGERKRHHGNNFLPLVPLSTPSVQYFTIAHVTIQYLYTICIPTDDHVRYSTCNNLTSLSVEVNDCFLSYLIHGERWDSAAGRSLRDVWNNVLLVSRWLRYPMPSSRGQYHTEISPLWNNQTRIRINQHERGIPRGCVSSDKQLVVEWWKCFIVWNGPCAALTVAEPGGSNRRGAPSSLIDHVFYHIFVSECLEIRLR